MKHRALPTAADLEQLWRDLGVSQSNGVMRWNDAAPLAAIRRAIVAARASATIASRD
jgi:hypothetical protein